MNDGCGIPMCDCPICGKKFIPAPYHVYRIRNKSGRVCVRVCSWTCLCAENRRIEAERAEKKRLMLLKNKKEDDT